MLFIGLPLLNRLQQRGRPGAPGAPPRPPARPGGAPQPDRQGPTTLAGDRDERDERDAERAPAPSRAEGQDPFDDLARRLEEARRRVREASSGEGAGGRTIADAGRPSGTVGGGSERPTIAGGGRQVTVAGRQVGEPSVPFPPAAPARPAPGGASPDPRPRQPTQRPTPQRPAQQRPSAQDAQTAQRVSTREAAERARRRSPIKKDAAAPALEVERVVGRSPYGTPGTRARRERRQGREGAGPDLLRLDAASVRTGLLWHMILSDAAAYGRGRMPSPRRRLR